jgi:hypothetical protein
MKVARAAMPASFAFFVVAVLTAVLFAYPATANAASVVATINGGGTAIMDPSRSDFGLAGTTSFGIHATLYSDGTAKGHVNCVDQVGSTLPGNIFGEVTSWEGNLDGSITLNVVGKFVGFPGGHPQDVSFSVTIERFGGAGVGQWTLSIGAATVCFETLLSGKIVMRRS